MNGITSTKESPLRELRAACKFFGVSQAGSKLRCFQRIMSHLKGRELKAAAEVAANARKRSVKRGTSASHCTSSHRRETGGPCTHSYTHLTLPPWCESCILHRVRRDRHLRTGAARMSGIPVISLDLCFAKAGIIHRQERSETSRGNGNGRR